MKYKWASLFIFSLFTAFFLSFIAWGQTVQIPEKIQFADLELELDTEAQNIIGQKTKYLTSNFLRYQKYQEHGRLYFPFIETALQDHNVPDDFKYLLFLESTHLSHNVLDGLMRPDSKGFWQMRTNEAKVMQLTINEDIDERNHIILSSNALAKFFAENNELLDNWVHTLLTKELGFTQTGEVIDKSLAGKKTMIITKDTHVYILSFLAHYITFKDKINPDPKSVKLLVYQEDANQKVQEVSQKFALTESVSDFNPWDINPDEALSKPYLVLVPVLPDEEAKVKTILGDKLIENKSKNESDNSDENAEEKSVNEEIHDAENTAKEEDNTGKKSEVHEDVKAKNKEIVEETSEGSSEPIEIIQPTGDFPVLKNQSTKEINGKTYVFVEANGISAMIAQADQTATDLAKASGLTEEKFMKYNEISSKDLQTGIVYYLNKKNKTAGTKTHLLQESEDLTDVSQMYGIRKSNLLTYNILSDKPKFIKYHQIVDGETEIMGESVVEDDSVFVGGRVLNLQVKLTGKAQFKFLRRIKKTPVLTEKLEILNPTTDAPILKVEGLENIDHVVFDSEGSESISEADENIDNTVSGSDSKENTKESSTKGENLETKEPSKKTTTYQKMPITSDYYIARPNDSWSVIAYVFSIPLKDLYLWNGSNAQTTLYVKQKVRITQPPAMPKPDVHIVTKGETVSSIAQRYGMNQEDLVRRNMLLTKKLPIGCKLYLSEPKPAQGWHTVKPKETLFSIARLYGISFRDLLDWNNMTLKSKIYKGSKLALESGLINGKKSENVTQSSSNPVENTAQSSEAIGNNGFSESTISEATASLISPIQTGMPDIPDPATLTMQITSKKNPDINEDNPETPVEDPNIYIVKNDTENIYEISGTTGVSTSDLKKWNNLPSGTMDLPKDTKLRITSPESTDSVQESTPQPEEIPSSTEENQVSDVSENISENTENQEVKSDTTEQSTESTESTIVIPTDNNGNDPASLTASIIQANADTQNQDSDKENTISKNMNLDASYYYEAEFGDAIDGVAKKFGITEDQLFKWNPDLDPDTSGFWGGEKLIIKDPNQ